jgi:hypothetical protein
MTRTISQATRAAIALGLVAMVAAAGAGGAGARSATAATGLPKLCQKAGLTPAMVKKIFGAKALIAGYGVEVRGYCPIVSPDAQTPSTGCEDGGDGCLVTDVTVGRASWYGQWLSNQLDYLDEQGRAHKAKFSGAGSSALLLTSTEYALDAVPMVLFKAGSHSIEIASSTPGQGEPASVYKLWKRLAHAIYPKLSK